MPHLVLHGHFYQPPRDDPWTEQVPEQPSAAPAHDWNVRITDECYRPNATARIFGEDGQVVAIVNDYELMSFNVGPTLASWLAEEAPDVLAAMVRADRNAGTAIAQAYHHVILPLANERDLRTQIRWGLADFTRTFGRAAEGMWLPETAVNDAVLAALVEEGIRFTILAPGQAATPPAAGTAYRWVHPDGSGRSIALVFYDGSLSHDVAFGAALMSSAQLVDRALEVVAERPDGLVCVATDGETFGHHHKFTERAVAHALAVVAPARGLTTGSVASWLAANPPTEPMAVVESAWSCAHGVGRWREDCGCSTGGALEANQRWRAPLRAALDLLRDHATEVFRRRAAGVLTDPWAARDAYVNVLADPSDDVTRQVFTARWLVPGADEVVAFTLLEVQRSAMAMYTSCAWFFWDLAGIETVQVLWDAARCIELLDDLGEPTGEHAFVEALSLARSNVAEAGDGGAIWRRDVVTARSTALDAASVVLVQLAAGGRPARAHAHLVGATSVRSVRVATTPELALTTATFQLVHRRTRRQYEVAGAIVHRAGRALAASATSVGGDPGGASERLDAIARAASDGARLADLLGHMAATIGPVSFEVADPDDLVALAATEPVATVLDELLRLTEDLDLVGPNTLERMQDAVYGHLSAAGRVPKHLGTHRVLPPRHLADPVEAKLVELAGRLQLAVVA